MFCEMFHLFPGVPDSHKAMPLPLQACPHPSLDNYHTDTQPASPGLPEVHEAGSGTTSHQSPSLLSDRQLLLHWDRRASCRHTSQHRAPPALLCWEETGGNGRQFDNSNQMTASVLLSLPKHQVTRVPSKVLPGERPSMEPSPAFASSKGIHRVSLAPSLSEEPPR